MSMTNLFNRRSFLQTGAAGAFAATLPMGGAMAQTPQRGGHLRVGRGHGQTTDTLDPATFSNGYMMGLAHTVHGYLTQMATDGTYANELAESWEPSADASEWRMKLRGGMTFHSGKPVTVEDVVTSLNYHRGPESTSSAASLISAVSEINIEGDDTVVFTLSGGNADFPYNMADYHLAILPAKDGKPDWRSGDGCGCYKLVDFQPGVRTLVERDLNYWNNDVGWFDSIEMLVLSDPSARTTALVSGDVDVIDKLELKTSGLLARRPGLNVVSVAGGQHFTFAMSTNRDPYTDRNVRLALKNAINREELVEKILFGNGSVGNDQPINERHRFYNPELEQRVYDPDKVQHYLKKAGVDNLSVTLSVADAAFAGAVDSAVLYQNSARKAGIDLKVSRTPNDGYWSSVWKKKPFSAAYWGGRPVADQAFSNVYQCGVAWNDAFWCNERFDELLIKARAELDEDKRRQMYWEMQQIVHIDGGTIIPMFANYMFAISDNVAHNKMGANSDMDGERWATRWWFA